MQILGTETFRAEEDPAKQAQKCLEEAAELSVAVKHEDRRRQEDELADYLQAGFNLADLMGIDYTGLVAIMGRCKRRNIARGRYR